jgi:hypothetical protein
MASKIEWDKVKPHVVVNESIQASLILFALAIGALKLPMLLGLWMLELVIVTALSASFYPQRGHVRALMDVIKIVLLCAALSVPLISFYLGSGGQLRLDALAVLSAMALLALRLASAARDAKKQPDPKRAWAKAALARGAVVMIGLFLGIFACLFAGLFISRALTHIVPNVAVDVGLGIVLLAVQVFLGAVMSTMTDAEFNAIAANPYID